MALLGKPFREGLSYKPCPPGYEDVRDFPPFLEQDHALSPRRGRTPSMWK
jgi:hypothetical protein